MKKTRVMAALAIVIALTAGVAGRAGRAEGNFFTALITGASREDGGRGYGDALAMIVMSYDWDGGGVRLLTLDRDEVFEGETLGSFIRLSGEDGAKRAVNGLYGLNVENAVTIDMSDVPAIVGCVGSVVITLDAEDAAIMGMEPGPTSMDAEAVRAYLAINTTADAKTEANNRRNAVLNALIAKAQTEGVSVSFDLVWTVLGIINTNIGFFDMISLGSSIMTSGLGGISRGAIPLAGEGGQAELVNAFLYG